MDVMKDLAFASEIEQMKKVFRMTKVVGTDRKENDAEHSFHVALMGLLLEKHAKDKFDVNKVVKMLLVHDIVEIYAGDTFAYDVKANEDKELREREAMEKIKLQLSEDTASLVENLWLEFENRSTDEAKYANAMDRLQPILSNLKDGRGGTWKGNNVTLEQVLKRIEPIKDFNDEVYEYVHSEVLQAVEKGYILRNN